MPADQMAERLGIELDDDRDYATAAGHALAILTHLPQEGESFVDKGWRFAIVDMDARKIDKPLVSELPGPTVDEAATPLPQRRTLGDNSYRRGGAMGRSDHQGG